MTAPEQITRNTLAQMIGRFFMVPLRLSINATLARHLHREGYGEYSLIVVLLLFLNLLVDLGVNDIAVREISKRWKRFEAFLPNLLLLKTALTLLASGTGLLAVRLLAYSPEVRSAMWTATLVLFLNALGSLGIIAYRSRLDMKYAVYCDLVAEALYLGLILVFIRQDASLQAVIRFMVLARFVHAVMMISILLRKYRPRLGRLDVGIVVRLLRQSYVLWFSQLMAVTYSYVDVIMLSKFSGEEAVGLYNASYALIVNALFFPIALMNSVFPVLCRDYPDNPAEFRRTVQRALDILWAVAVPMAVFGTLFAGDIVRFLYGEAFAPSAGALRILIWACAVMFLSVVMPFTFIAARQQNKIIIFGLIGVCLNVGMNLYLIPRYGFIGASIATAATEVIVLAVTVVVLFFLLRFVPSPRVFVKCLLAGAGGGALMHAVRPWGGAAAAGLGAAAFLCLYTLLRVFSRQEILRAVGRGSGPATEPGP